MTPNEAFPFDAPYAVELTRARVKFIQEFLRSIRKQVELGTALDVGCGVGYFSAFLAESGFHVTALDGREENILEARRRHPSVNFFAVDAEAIPLGQFTPADLVLCAGLLYHLENPFRVIRNLHSLTAKLLIIEGMCLPGSTASMELLDEGTTADQGLNFVAFYPSEAALVKMLYRSGFPFVYIFTRLPEHPEYGDSSGRKRERTVVLASKVSVNAPNLTLTEEPFRPVHGISDPWTSPLMKSRYFLGNLRRSLIGIFRKSPPSPS